MFNTYLFLDFETTGLIDPEVTEVCALAVDKTHFDRIRHKLVLCCSTSKNIEPIASNLTGLTDSMIANNYSFNDRGVHLLLNFIKILPGPVCIIAHNGNAFDFKILKNATSTTKELPSNIYSLDSLHLFKEIDKSRGVYHQSYSLKSIYNRFYPKDTNHREHGAEVDCETLLKCFLKMECINYIESTFVLNEICKL